jgi:hypothetical protein
MKTNAESKKGLNQIKWSWQSIWSLFSTNRVKQSYKETGRVFSTERRTEKSPNSLEDYFKSSIEKAERIKFYQ